MNLAKVTRTLALSAVLATSAMPVTGTIAAQRDIDLLRSYIGEWRGRGTMGSGDNEETVLCKLDVTSSAPTKINYNGRCSIAGGNIAIAGTMAYVEDNNRYEAVMSSNAAFQGVAIGTRRGSGIDFVLRDKNPDTGAAMNIAVGFELRGDQIAVDFRITDVESGNFTTATVPFEKV